MRTWEEKQQEKKNCVIQDLNSWTYKQVLQFLHKDDDPNSSKSHSFIVSLYDSTMSIFTLLSLGCDAGGGGDEGGGGGGRGAIDAGGDDREDIQELGIYISQTRCRFCQEGTHMTRKHDAL